MGQFLISIVVLPMTMTASGEAVILAMRVCCPLHTYAGLPMKKGPKFFPSTLLDVILKN